MKRIQIKVKTQQTSKSAEYDGLRQEIINCISACDNYKIAMYTTTVAILCVAFELENPILFLLPYITLFAFQWSIASKNENMIVIAAYISVLLEKDHGWESENIQLKKIMRKDYPSRKPSSLLSRLVGRISSAQLGLLCSISSIVYSLLDIFSAADLTKSVRSSICIVCSIVLYVLVRIQTRSIFRLGERKTAYIENLRNALMGNTPMMEKELQRL